MCIDVSNAHEVFHITHHNIEQDLCRIILIWIIYFGQYIFSLIAHYAKSAHPEYVFHMGISLTVQVINNMVGMHHSQKVISYHFSIIQALQIQMHYNHEVDDISFCNDGFHNTKFGRRFHHMRKNLNIINNDIKNKK